MKQLMRNLKKHVNKAITALRWWLELTHSERSELDLAVTENKSPGIGGPGGTGWVAVRSLVLQHLFSFGL